MIPFINFKDNNNAKCHFIHANGFPPLAYTSLLNLLHLAVSRRLAENLPNRLGHLWHFQPNPLGHLWRKVICLKFAK